MIKGSAAVQGNPQIAAPVCHERERGSSPIIPILATDDCPSRASSIDQRHEWIGRDAQATHAASKAGLIHFFRIELAASTIDSVELAAIGLEGDLIDRAAALPTDFVVPFLGFAGDKLPNSLAVGRLDGAVRPDFDNFLPTFPAPLADERIRVFHVIEVCTEAREREQGNGESEEGGLGFHRDVMS